MKMKLYWVATADHDEDWFVVAGSAREAAIFHEREEGYDPGDAWAEEVVAIPPGLNAEKGWPTEELLGALGASYLKEDTPRVVEIDGRKFCEGLLQSHIDEVTDDIFEAQGLGRLNDSVKEPRN
jgi:hypothetical protein